MALRLGKTSFQAAGFSKGTARFLAGASRSGGRAADVAEHAAIMGQRSQLEMMRLNQASAAAHAGGHRGQMRM